MTLQKAMRIRAELKKEISYKGALVLLCLGIIALGLFTVFFGDILVPVLCALLAVLFTFENKERRVLSYAISALLLISNLAAILFIDTFCSFFGFCAVVFAILIYLFFSRGVEKADCVAVLTAVGTFFVIINFVYFAMNFTGNYTLGAVSEFVSLLRVAFEKIMNESLAMMIASVPESEAQLSQILSQIGVIFDSFKMISLSFAVIIGFVLSGVALKFYSFLVFKMSDLGASVFNWKFKTSRVFAYFYIILSVLSVFTMSADSVVSVAVANLYNIFMVVFAYLGFNFAVQLLSTRRSKAFAYFIIVLALLMFSSFAIEILSLMGVFFTITDRGHIGEDA
jgi:hypothetical protein